MRRHNSMCCFVWSVFLLPQVISCGPVAIGTAVYFAVQDTDPGALPELVSNKFDVGFDDVEYFAGESCVNAEFSISNIGTDVAGSFHVAWYISPDAVIDPNEGDAFLDFEIIDGLSVGESTGVHGKRFILPPVKDGIWAEDGIYYIGMVIDSLNEVREEDESNNSNQGPGVDRDYVIVSVNERPQTGPDLVVENMKLIVDSVYAGYIYDPLIRIDFCNLGSVESGVFDIDWYLSKNSIISEKDKLLDHQAMSLSGLSCNTDVPKSIELPPAEDPFWQGDGSYYIGVVVTAKDWLPDDIDICNNIAFLEIEVSNTE